MDEYSGLTFDWDGVSLEDDTVQKELNDLCEMFGNNFVWYRVSSSQTGLHVIIGELFFDEQSGVLKIIPIAMDVEEQMKYREQNKIECRGRMFSDSMRRQGGLRTSRIFNNKNGLRVGVWKRFK